MDRLKLREPEQVIFHLLFHHPIVGDPTDNLCLDVHLIFLLLFFSCSALLNMVIILVLQQGASVGQVRNKEKENILNRLLRGRGQMVGWMLQLISVKKPLLELMKRKTGKRSSVD